MRRHLWPVYRTRDGKSGKPLPPQIQAKVDPRILAELRGEALPAHLAVRPDQAPPPQKRPPLAQTRFLVTLKAQADLERARARTFATRRPTQRTAVVDALVETAQATQGPVKALLDAHVASGDATAYLPLLHCEWVGRRRQPGHRDRAGQARGRVAHRGQLSPDPIRTAGPRHIPLPALADRPGSRSGGGLDPANWNIDLVDAERVWNELGIDGRGAVVADFDTGVDWDHPALKAQYRGWDGTRPTTTITGSSLTRKTPPTGTAAATMAPAPARRPMTASDHGTHTMGTMVGDGGTPATQIGMAPGATVDRRARHLRPHHARRIRRRHRRHPHLSVADVPHRPERRPVYARLLQSARRDQQLVGLVQPRRRHLSPDRPGPARGGHRARLCLGQPFRRTGQHWHAGLDPRSDRRGRDRPGRRGHVVQRPRARPFTRASKSPNSPRLAAAFAPASLDGYASFSGTSMAAPHVSGLIALMISADLQDGRRDLDVDELLAFMQYSAVDLGPSGPDDEYGYGRIDAYRAVRWVLGAGDLQGTVRDANTQAPIDGATMTGIAVSTGDRFVTRADASGVYSATVPGGVYDVRVEAFGYAGKTFAGVAVLTGTDTLVDFEPARPCPPAC